METNEKKLGRVVNVSGAQVVVLLEPPAESDALLDSIRVAGKTGSLSGSQPQGRYEWFIGVAPADRPRIAVAVLLVQGHLWWRNASQVAAEVFGSVFCEKGRCEVASAERWLRPRARAQDEDHST